MMVRPVFNESDETARNKEAQRSFDPALLTGGENLRTTSREMNCSAVPESYPRQVTNGIPVDERATTAPLPAAKLDTPRVVKSVPGRNVGHGASRQLWFISSPGVRPPLPVEQLPPQQVNDTAPPLLTEVDTSPSFPTVPPGLRGKQRDHSSSAGKRSNWVPVAEESISLLDTISMFTVKPGKETWQQQEIFINDIVQDIALRSTAILPVVALTPSKRVEVSKQQDIAKTAGGAAVAGAGDLGSAVLRYATNVAMTHMVSQSIYGIFVAISTIVTIAGGAAKFGLDSAVLRFLSFYRVKGERRLAAGIVRFAVWATLISGLIFGVVLYFSATFLAYQFYHNGNYELPLKEIALAVPLTALQFVLASGLQALKAIKWKVYVDRLIQPALTLVLMGVFYLLGLRMEALTLATVCGYLAAVIAGQYYLSKGTKRLVRDAAPQYQSKMWMRFSLPMFFNSIIRNLLNSTDILFLGAFAVPAQIGLYGAADRVTVFIIMPLVALSVIFSSVIAEHQSRREHKQLENMFKVVTKWSFSLSLPVFLCCFLFHDAILGIFGERYIAAGLVLMILSFGNFVDAGAGLVGQLLAMTGRPRVVLVNTGIAIFINVGLCILLVPRYTIIGAAIAAALGVIVFNVLGLVAIYWTMKMQPYRWDYLKPLAAGGVASLVGMLLLRVIHVGYGHLAILGALGLILPFAATYVLVLAILRFSEEDMMVFNAVRAKFGGGRSV